MKSGRTFLFGLIVLVGAVGATLGTGWLNPWLSHYVEGIDVSRHQGAIDWKALAGAGVKFAYIKASEGADHRDDRFAANWRDSAAAGVRRGAYHYFTLCRPGAAQAANFIATVPVEPNALPHAVDVEQKFPCREGPTITDAPGEIAVFLDMLEARYGRRPIIYTTSEFNQNHLDGTLLRERFWLRNLFAQPDFRRDAWVIWQYRHDGKKPGVQGPVDLNYFRGDEAAFEAFAAGAPRP
ncbi:MAG: GH25 family lysozyme [Pseudomonadota bacterium]